MATVLSIITIHAIYQGFFYFLNDMDMDRGYVMLNEIGLHDKWMLEKDKGKTNLNYREYSDICCLDPTVRTIDHNRQAGKYCNWLLRVFDISKIRDENYKHRLRVALEQYNDGLRRGILRREGISNDIGSFSSADELLGAMEKVMGGDAGTKVSLSVSNNMERLKGQFEVVGESPNWMVVKPNTWEAERYFGSGTEWCTVANGNYFNDYTSDGPLYITVPKSMNNKLKMQFHWESRSFADYNDNVYHNPKTCIYNVLGEGKEFNEVCEMWGGIDAKFDKYWFIKFGEVEDRLAGGTSPEMLFDEYYPSDKYGVARVVLHGKYNFIGSDGKLLSPDQWYDSANSFDEGFSTVGLNGKHNLMGVDGKLLSPNQWYEYIGLFDEGFAPVRLNRKWNFIGTDGKLVWDKPVDEWFSHVYWFDHGSALVKLNGEEYYLDRNGKLHYEKPRSTDGSNRHGNNTIITEALSTNDVYSKYYSDIDKSVFDAAVKADPTSDADHAGRYVKWILGLYKRGNWKPGDSYETKDALSKFHRLRNSLEIKDINGYKSVRQLIDAVSDKKSTSDIKRSGAEKVYEDGEWLVIVPHTEEASKLYGKGTTWCTAADNDNYFDYYNDQGPLYINIRKRDGEKWQFHFESESFMDAEDDPVKIKDIGLSEGLVRFYDKVCPYFKALFEYDYVCDFHEGFAAVKLNGKWNFIDTNGKILSPGQWFDWCGKFTEGFAMVEIDGKCNFIDTEWNILSPDQWFDWCDNFHKGFARVELDGKWNFIDTEGNVLSPDQWFDWCGNFQEGFALVGLDGKWNFIDTEGNILSPGQWFNDCSLFSGGFASVKLDRKWYDIDRGGNLYDIKGNGVVRVGRNELMEMITESVLNCIKSRGMNLK